MGLFQDVAEQVDWQVEPNSFQPRGCTGRRGNRRQAEKQVLRSSRKAGLAQDDTSKGMSGDGYGESVCMIGECAIVDGQSRIANSYFFGAVDSLEALLGGVGLLLLSAEAPPDLPLPGAGGGPEFFLA